MDINKNIQNIEEALLKVKNKENRIYFYVSNAIGTEGSIAVTYTYAKTLKDEGYNVAMLHDNLEYKKPTHISSELLDVEHLALNKHRNKIKVSVIDIIVYPESHPDVIERTRAMNCIKVVLCQSHSRLLPSMLPGMNWMEMGIDQVITTSNTMSTYIKTIFGEHTPVSVVTPSIDDRIFNNEGVYKKPSIAVYGRHQKDILKLAKEFYAMYPELNMFAFKDMRDMSKEEFAKSLRESFLAVWIDRESAFPMFPIECYKSKTKMIGLVPDMVTEHTKATNKNLTITPFKLPVMVGIECSKYLVNEPIEYNEELINTYDTQSEREGIIKVFKMLIGRRESQLNNTYKKLTNDNK